MTFTVFYYTFFAYSVCLYISVCLCWAMLPDSKKMIMIGNSSSEQTYFLPHVLLVCRAGCIVGVLCD